jgi:hypothetical protein
VTGTGRCRFCGVTVPGPDLNWTIHLFDHCPAAHAWMGSPPRPAHLPPPRMHPACFDALAAIPGWGWRNPGTLAAYLRDVADRLEARAHEACVADAAGSDARAVAV